VGQDVSFLLILFFFTLYSTYLYGAKDVFSASFINRIRVTDNNISNIETFSDLDMFQYEHIFDDLESAKFKLHFRLSYGRRVLSEDAKFETELRELSFCKKLCTALDIFIGTIYLKMFKRNILYQYNNPWEAFFIKTSFRGLGAEIKIASCNYLEFYSGLGPRQWDWSEETGLVIIRDSFRIKPVEASIVFCWVSDTLLKHYYLFSVAHNVNRCIRYVAFGSISYNDTRYSDFSFSFESEVYLGERILSKAVIEVSHVEQRNVQFNYGLELSFIPFSQGLKNLSLVFFLAKIAVLVTPNATITFGNHNLIYKLCCRYKVDKNVYFDTYYLREKLADVLVNEVVVKF